MREELVGYLIGALEPHEVAAVEAQLSHDESLRRDLNALRRSLSILEPSREHLEPPSGLAARTCQFVSQQVHTTLAPRPAASRWRLADFVVAAGIFIAASMLFFPAIYHSRYSAQIANCENNLRRIGQALAAYSGLHHGDFPGLSKAGPQSAAGVYAVKLRDAGLVDEPQWFVCPSSPLAEKIDQFHIPSLNELEHVPREKLIELERLMGGSYGYNLGYFGEDGEYHGTRNLHRKNFAILADAPVATEGSKPYSLNHGGWGHNVLFEDGHVDYLKACTADGCKDNIFLNDQGRLAPGIHRDDAVIGPSAIHPLITPVSDRGR